MRALVLGGSGYFGRLIAGHLARDPSIEVTIAGRDLAKAQAFATQIGASSARIDVAGSDLAACIARCTPQLVISTAGPFQEQDYRVARAAMACGAHYVDIADARAFVCGIGVLDAEARKAGLLAVSGASSVPALSGAVVDHYARDVDVEGVDIGICTSSRLPGPATVRAVLGYAGQPFKRLDKGVWIEARGWRGLRRHAFRTGRFARWLADCDVPDLELLPARHPTLRSVRFGAGIQPAAAQWGLAALATGASLGFVPALARWAPALSRLARMGERWSSARSAMFVAIRARDAQGKPRDIGWELVAEAHDGANVPCMAAVILARKLARDQIAARGAMPCVGLVALDEYLDALRPLRIRWAAC